ncbi:MAG: peptidoglycan DD-metalloendopeptidase family protein [Candidatus Pacebacteria bacterium]|nr:peptidoglycan DD-metalloendopeptidase family protein [Candidatus Paceibacterota bacterium]
MPFYKAQGSSEKISSPDTYWIPGALIAASLLLGIGITLIPQTAGAFWPFSVLRASDGTNETSIVHDSSLKLLEAATNPDPSPAQAVGELATSEGSALIANAGVDGTIPEVDHTGSNGSISTYTVQEGDSISEIASMHGVSVDTILWANGLTRKSAIRPGMTLVVLPVSGVRHTVQKGETLAGVAKKFDADAEDIAAYNGLDLGDGLSVGTQLIIPGGELSTVVPVTKKVTSVVKKVTTSIKTGGSMGAIRSVGDTSHAGSFTNPVPAGHLSQGIHGWNGVDIAAPSGSPVYAAAGGTVIVSRMGGWNGGYGNYIVIDHGDGAQTLYAHLSADNVSVGQKVTKGQGIGAVGKTGKATGFHLHFEVRGAKNPFAN